MNMDAFDVLLCFLCGGDERIECEDLGRWFCHVLSCKRGFRMRTE